MNYFDRIQMAYNFARQKEGVLQSLIQSFGSASVAQLAVKSGRDETARFMMHFAEDNSSSFEESWSVVQERLDRACFGNRDLSRHFLDELQAFSRCCDHTRRQVMDEVCALYGIRAPQLKEDGLQTDGFWGNPIEWDACIVQNPEMAAVSPYTHKNSYSAALEESREMLHEYLQSKLDSHSFEDLDICRLLIEDKSSELQLEDYREMALSQPGIGSFLPKEVLADPAFRETLMETDPVLALRTIPREQQTDTLRLMAISQNAEAFRWIDDDDFKRRHFVIQEMIPMRMESHPTLEQCQALQDKASAMLDAIQMGDKERREALAEQNFMQHAVSRIQAHESQLGISAAPSDFSKTAQFHYTEHVPQDQGQEQFCFYDDSDGNLDYNRDTQKFIFTSRDGRKRDMTDSMETLRLCGRPFQSLGPEEKSRFLAMQDFTTKDAQGRATDFIAQRAPDGTSSFISRLSSKAAGNVYAVAAQKARKLWDDAMAAGQL